MVDPEMSGSWGEMFAGHLREKQAGPLTAPYAHKLDPDLLRGIMRLSQEPQWRRA
jgi:hypothetical protein